MTETGARTILRVFTLDVVAKVALGLMAVALIRYMPAAEYARYTVALAAVALGVQVLASTFNRIYVVGYERLHMRSSTSSFLSFQLLMVALVAVLAFPWHGSAGRLYWAVITVLLASCLSEFAKTAYQQELRFDRFAQVELARALLTVLAVAGMVGFALSRGGDVRAEAVLAAQAGAMLTVFAATAARRLDVREVFHPTGGVRFAAAVMRGPYSWLFGYYALIGVLSQLDVFVLSTLASSEQVASYGAAFRFYSLLALALASVHAVLLPVVQQVDTPQAQDTILARQWRFLAVFAPVVLAGAWASGWIIPFLDGGRYPDAVPAFRLLAVSSVVSFAFSPHGHVVLRFEDFRFLCLGAVTSLVGHATILHVTVPAWGAVGAAAATLVTFAFFNGSIWLRARWHRRRWMEDPSGAGAPPERVRAGLGS